MSPPRDCAINNLNYYNGDDLSNYWKSQWSNQQQQFLAQYPNLAPNYNTNPNESSISRTPNFHAAYPNLIHAGLGSNMP